MKLAIFGKMALPTILMFAACVAHAQQPSLQYFRPNDKSGLNVFETSKETEETAAEFEGVKVRIGGAFALQYQGLDHENDANSLVELDKNFNLASANFDIDVQLYDGVRMHLRTFLSSRHHSEAWVKGGYLQIDKLDFIKEGFLESLMEKVTIRIGHMENNYGDAHFRRTDNGHAMFNPFVGNYIMDSFTTEVGGEVYYQYNGIIAMGGFTNGRVNQSTTNTDTKASLLGKIGYDKQLNDDLRVRLTGSFFATRNNNRVTLYGGDRAGGRYYHVMQLPGDTAPGGTVNDFSGRLNPGLNTDMTSIMVNPFVKFKGFEFFGIFERVSGRDDATDGAFEGDRTWTQLAAEALYRFGPEEKLYVGARYNTASGQLQGVESDKSTIDRINVGAGWFMTKNILTKVEYVSQTYSDFLEERYAGGSFSGIMIEATIGF